MCAPQRRPSAAPTIGAQGSHVSYRCACTPSTHLIGAAVRCGARARRLAPSVPCLPFKQGPAPRGRRVGQARLLARYFVSLGSPGCVFNRGPSSFHGPYSTSFASQVHTMLGARAGRSQACARTRAHTHSHTHTRPRRLLIARLVSTRTHQPRAPPVLGLLCRGEGAGTSPARAPCAGPSLCRGDGAGNSRLLPICTRGAAAQPSPPSGARRPAGRLHGRIPSILRRGACRPAEGPSRRRSL
jgi:hypothetical protein